MPSIFKVCFLHHASISGFDLSASQEGGKKAHVGPGGGGGWRIFSFFFSL